MDKVIVVGASGHAKLIIDILELNGQTQIVGLVDSFRPIGYSMMNYTVLGTEEDLPSLVESHWIDGVVVAIGDNFVRFRMVKRIQALCPELTFVSVVHPHAVIARSVVIGVGSVVMAGACVNAGAKIGQHCIVNKKASLAHDAVLEDFASLAPGVTTGGNCRIGQFTAVGIGATLIHGVSVGAHSVIGAGALVLQPVHSHTVAYGSPARVIRQRQEGDVYL